MIRHVSFDNWGTVIKGNPEYFLLRAKYLKSKYELDSNIFGFGRILNGIVEKTGFEILPDVRFCLIMNCAGIPDENIDLEDWKLVHEEILEKAPPILIDQNFSTVISRLYDLGISTSILCNTSNIAGSYFRRYFKKLGIDFLFQIYSNESIIAKPNPRIFNLMRGLSRVDPAEILHVGDNKITDFDSAIYAGMNSILFEENLPQYERIFDYIKSEQSDDGSCQIQSDSKYSNPDSL